MGMYGRKFPKSRKFFLFLGDIGIMSMSYCIAASLVLHKNVFFPKLEMYSGMLPVMLVIAVLLFNINGLYSIDRKRFAEIILSMFVSMVSLVILMMAFSFFIREFSYSRGQLLVSSGIATLCLIFWRRMMWHIERAIHSTLKILLIGNEIECTHVYHRLMQQPQLNLQLQYICTDFKNKLWKQAAATVDQILICPHIQLQDKAEIIQYCYAHNKIPLLIPSMYEVFCNGSELGKIDDIPVFELQSLHLSLETRILKRLMDSILSVIALIITFPLMFVTAIFIKMDDGGPVFYKQLRVGRYEKTFYIYKFRTMRVDAETKSGPQLATEQDPRITRVGRFLRRIRLDELPQIGNVLLGDMSIVGPRPERPYFVEQFKEKNPLYIYRTNVKPGITGLAQVYGKYNTSTYDKLIYDLLYIQKCNFLEDMVLIIQTVRILCIKSATEGVTETEHIINVKEYEYRKENKI
jgi:exopolysaccharide biosynthesis polyprenyl glycosylphosphotransferase